jgi:gliding motility-associated-like protein
VQTQYEYSIDEGKYWSVQNIFRNVDAGNYTVQVRSGAGCLSLTSQATILEPDSLAYVIRSVAPTCPECTDGEISISVSGGTSPYSYDWHGYNVYDSVFTGIGAGIYPITISDINGCDINLDYPLTAGELFIPNAFSPNGGNRNEKWIIKILENRPDCLVQVYDRSGKLVFYSDNNYQPWDGTYLNQGGELPAGTYFYRIQIDRNDENKPPQLGTVTILR